MKRYIVIVILIHIGFNINEIAAQKHESKPLLELYEDNDLLLFINGTDQYYTNGTRISYSYSRKVNGFSFFDKGLIGFKDDTIKRYSWGLMQTMFTPENISKDSLQNGDWPYAGCLFMSHSVYSVNRSKNLGIRSEYLLGIIGPWSFASETQTFVHKLINSTSPNGWQWQIDNYPILNYNISIEPKIITSRHFDAIANFDVNVGSLMNQFKTGLKFRLGVKNNYYRMEPKKYQFYLTYHLNGAFVIYSAYLEGGFFDKRKYEEGISKGYRLNESQISRFYLESQLGINFRYNNFGISYLIKYRTRQTIETDSLIIGNITLFVPLYKKI